MAGGSHKQRKARKDYTAQTRVLTEIVDQPRQVGYSKTIPSWQHYTANRNAKISRPTNLRDSEA